MRLRRIPKGARSGPRTGTEPRKESQAAPFAVALIYHPADAGAARQLGTLLRSAGVTAAPEVTADTDAVVVFLSAFGLAQPGWANTVTALTAAATRLIPVRVGRIADTGVPERLRALNWIDWQPDNVRATFGYVLAGLLSDPGRRDLAKQLSHEAETWVRSGRSDVLLIADYRRARRMAGTLRDLEEDQLAAPTPAIREFVQRSVRFSRPRHRRRRTWRVLSVAGAFIALSTVAAALPAITIGSFNNKESIVTTGDPETLRDLPEWSAANAAALLVDGTPAEQSLARSCRSPLPTTLLTFRGPACSLTVRSAPKSSWRRRPAGSVRPSARLLTRPPCLGERHDSVPAVHRRLAA